MEVIEKAVQWAIDTANDNSHGYSQADRWGPDYDCSSFVISAYEQAGVPLREAGASYTGNMRPAMIACGFVDVTTQIGLSSGHGIQAGDVLLNYAAHTCLAIGGGRVANCRTDEGNPQSGDQSGNEIRLQAYWNFPWDCCLRYKGQNIGTPSAGGSGSSGTSGNQTEPAADPAQPFPAPAYPMCSAELAKIHRGDKGVPVERMQTLLIARGYDCGGQVFGGVEKPDGDFGPATELAVKDVQTAEGIAADGIVGPDTWSALIMT